MFVVYVNKIGATHYHAHELGLSNKGCAIKDLVVCVTSKKYVYKGGIIGEVVWDTPKKRWIFMTSHMTL